MPVRRLLLGGVALAVVLLVAGAATWWFFIREENKPLENAPAIPEGDGQTASPTAAGGSSSASGIQTFRIVPQIQGISARTEASYFADEKFAGVSLPSTAKGTTAGVTGEFHLTPDGLDPSKTSQFTVDLTGLRSDQGQRDRQVQDRGLETSRFPRATFKATRLEGWPREFPQGQQVTMQLTGMFDLHGVQKEVTWEVKANKSGNVMTGIATINFRYADFNIEVLNVANFVSVEDDVTLQVQVVAQAN